MTCSLVIESLLTCALLLTLTSAQTAATLTCRYWHPHGPSFASNHVALTFGESNATASNPLRIANATAPIPARYGSVFHIDTCNSTSLNAYGGGYASCSDGGCRYVVSEYLHIINPSTGHCLTWEHYNASSSDLTFAPCEPAPANFAQLWGLSQEMDYGQSSFAGTPFYGVPSISPSINVDPGYLTLFELAADGKTVTLRAKPNLLEVLEASLSPA